MPHLCDTRSGYRPTTPMTPCDDTNLQAAHLPPVTARQTKLRRLNGSQWVYLAEEERADLPETGAPL